MRIQIISLFLSLSLIIMPINLLYAKDESAENLVATNIKEINERNWPDIPTLWCKSQRNVMKQFFNDKHNKERKVGLFNIKDAQLIATKEIPFEYARINLPSFIESVIEPRILYVAVNYDVYIENKYHINGVNYFLVVTATENRQRKIVLIPHVPVSSLIRVGYRFGTDDEKTFDERRLKFDK